MESEKQARSVNRPRRNPKFSPTSLPLPTYNKESGGWKVLLFISLKKGKTRPPFLPTSPSTALLLLHLDPPPQHPATGPAPQFENHVTYWTGSWGVNRKRRGEKQGAEEIHRPSLARAAQNSALILKGMCEGISTLTHSEKSSLPRKHQVEVYVPLPEEFLAYRR